MDSKPNDYGAICLHSRSDFCWRYSRFYRQRRHFGSAYQRACLMARYGWFGVWRQKNGCVFNPSNELTGSMAQRGFLKLSDAVSWSVEHQEDLQYRNDAGGFNTDDHYVIVSIEPSATGETLKQVRWFD